MKFRSKDFFFVHKAGPVSQTAIFVKALYNFFMKQMFYNPKVCSDALESLNGRQVCPWREWINIKMFVSSFFLKALAQRYTFLKRSPFEPFYPPVAQDCVRWTSKAHFIGRGTRPKYIMPAPSLIVASGFNLHLFGWRDILILSAALWELDCNLLRGLSRTRH